MYVKLEIKAGEKVRKYIIVVIIIVLLIVGMIKSLASTTEMSLIEDIKIELKSAENPNRLEVRFNLIEPIDLSQGSSDIIFEYFIINSSGEFEAVNYRKDKTWAGYLNSYDNYPEGEHKYSSGVDNKDYSDIIPPTTIYTSVKTGGSIDTAQIAAVKVTVFRADGTGEEVTVYSNILNVEKNTGIRLASTALELPVGTVLIADELTSGDMYETVNEVLAGNKNFVAFDIRLEAEAQEVIPNGHVLLKIPIPQSFSSPHLKVYRIDDDGTKTPYTTDVTMIDGVQYVTFETNHFSTYVLLELFAYPYEVDYYRDAITEENLIDTIIGSSMFVEGYQLTADDVAADLGKVWVELKKPVINYNKGIVQGGYPVISQITENNKVKILYKKGNGMASTHVITAEDQENIEEKHEWYIQGYENNEIRPDDNLTRAEAAMIFYRLIGNEDKTAKSPSEIFHDVDTDVWYAEAVTHLYDSGIIIGYDDMTYRPDRFITRAEIVKLLSMVDNSELSKGPSFFDVTETHWAYSYISLAASRAWIRGYEDGTFRPDDYATRAEIIYIINRVMDRRISEDNLPPNINTWADLSNEHWAYADIMEATHSHTFVRENEMADETWIDIEETAENE